MSIAPRHIDRTGERPCIPQLALLAAMRAAAEGRPPTLRSRMTKALARLSRRITQ
jgi:hypothetical protein